MLDLAVSDHSSDEQGKKRFIQIEADLKCVCVSEDTLFLLLKFLNNNEN